MSLKTDAAVIGGQAYARKSRPSLDDYANELKARNRFTPAVQEAASKAAKIKQEYSAVFYIAGALTGMSEDIKERYVRLSELIATYEGMFGYAPHLHGTDPVVHPHVTPQEVRDIDYLFAAVVPDAHFNFLHPIAHGSAIEEGWAETSNIPALYLVPKGVKLSRLVRGMYNIASTIVYDDFENDGLPQIRTFLDNMCSQQVSAGCRAEYDSTVRMPARAIP